MGWRRTTTSSAVLLTLSLGILACANPPVARAASESFASNSPWRTPIGAEASVDPNSGAMIGWAARRNAMNANLDQYGIPIYQAGASTPRYSVRCTAPYAGPCPLQGGGGGCRSRSARHHMRARTARWS